MKRYVSHGRRWSMYKRSWRSRARPRRRRTLALERTEEYIAPPRVQGRGREAVQGVAEDTGWSCWGRTMTMYVYCEVAVVTAAAARATVNCKLLPPPFP